MVPNEADNSHLEDGNTPLDDDEAHGLIPPHVQTQAELNQWEAQNIERALTWSASRKPNVLGTAALRELHRRMFDETWEWAGEYRRSDKNISPYHWSEVPRLLRDLVANIEAQYENSPKTEQALDELAARFHHELVRIHPWANGNGRHSRFATDLLLRQWGRPPFTWGGATPAAVPKDVRAQYMSALRAADAGKPEELFRFVRSQADPEPPRPPHARPRRS